MAEPAGSYTDTTICIGYKACISACPFGVIHMSPVRNIAQKCTFCYDRLKIGLSPACAQACPTQSIRFGPLKQLQSQAHARVRQLHSQGQTKARLYGADDKVLA